MKTYPRQGFTLSWAFLLLLVCCYEMAHGQPQAYFKNSVGHALPAKSLPRIGRRSDLDFPSPSNVNVDDMWNDLYSVNNYRPRPESVLLWRKFMGENSNSYNNNYPPEDSQLSLTPSFYKFKERK